jgi:6-phosphogluconolactonase
MPQKLKVEYFVEPDAVALARRAARYFVEAAAQAADARGRARVAISGGGTPKVAFEMLADPAQPFRAAMPWDKLDLWWVDERCVPPDHPDSNYRMTRLSLLDHVPLAPAQIHRMEGELAPDVAASRYEAELRSSFRLEGNETPCPEFPRFDLIALGLGPDGHTASLFPHTAALREVTRLAVANHVQNKDAWRITLTWPVINNGASVFFLIAGADKAQILSEVMTGPRDPERLPSQLIAPAGGILTLLLDKAAASQLPATDGQGPGTLEREE